MAMAVGGSAVAVGAGVALGKRCGVAVGQLGAAGLVAGSGSVQPQNAARANARIRRRK